MMEPNGCYFPMTDQAGDLPIAIAWETKKCIKKDVLQEFRNNFGKKKSFLICKIKKITKYLPSLVV